MNEDLLYLEHIRDALQDIAAYTSTGREVFFAERMRQDATLRKLEVIGQAVTFRPVRLSSDPCSCFAVAVAEC